MLQRCEVHLFLTFINNIHICFHFKALQCLPYYFLLHNDVYIENVITQLHLHSISYTKTSFIVDTKCTYYMHISANKYATVKTSAAVEFAENE